MCTIGPASEPQDVMQALADEGMKIGRLNFSHAVKYEEMTEKLQTFRGIKASFDLISVFQRDLNSNLYASFCIFLLCLFPLRLLGNVSNDQPGRHLQQAQPSM